MNKFQKFAFGVMAALIYGGMVAIMVRAALLYGWFAGALTFGSAVCASVAAYLLLEIMHAGQDPDEILPPIVELHKISEEDFMKIIESIKREEQGAKDENDTEAIDGVDNDNG